MNKPEFPKPRMIQEDFLPSRKINILKNYRIKKYFCVGSWSYRPQKRVLWVFWSDIVFPSVSYTCFDDANRALVNYIKEKQNYTNTEYLKPDFKLAQQPPNPPPNVV